MANNGTLISGNVAISDVQRVLGASANDLGTLCKHANINIWSRYKPILTPASVTNKKANLETYNSSGLPTKPSDARKTARFGVVPYVGSGSAPHVEMFESHKWTYSPPSGGESNPYRATDFCGYKHDAVAPMYILYPADDTLLVNDKESDNYKYSLIINVFQGLDLSTSLNVGLNDVLTSDQMKYYPGILMRGKKKYNGVQAGYYTYCALTSTSKLEDLLVGTNMQNGIGVLLDMGRTPFGGQNGMELEIVPVLCANPYTGNYFDESWVRNGTFINLQGTDNEPPIKRFTVKMITWENLLYAPTIRVKATNTTSGGKRTITIKACEVSIRKKDTTTSVYIYPNFILATQAGNQTISESANAQMLTTNSTATQTKTFDYSTGAPKKFAAINDDIHGSLGVELKADISGFGLVSLGFVTLGDFITNASNYSATTWKP